MREQYQVLCVERYRFADEATGEIKSGAKIICTDGISFEDDRRKGAPIIEIPAPFEAYDQFTVLPAPYIIDFAIVPAGRGKTRLNYRGCELVKSK